MMISVCQSVQHFGSGHSIPQLLARIALKFGRFICGSQRLTPNDFFRPLNFFSIVLPTGQSFHVHTRNINI